MVGGDRRCGGVGWWWSVVAVMTVAVVVRVLVLFLGVVVGLLVGVAAEL